MKQELLSDMKPEELMVDQLLLQILITLLLTSNYFLKGKKPRFNLQVRLSKKKSEKLKIRIVVTWDA